MVIRAADCPEMPWKNGGGTTREIAAFPPGAGMDHFLWRLSMAKVERAGPFSAFTGIDRKLAVISGRLRLSGPGIDVVLDDAGAPCPFDGGTALSGDPLDGPVLDLNAMARRGHYSCVMRRLVAGDTAGCAGTGLLVALEPQQLAGNALQALDCVRFDAPLQVQGKALAVDFIAA
ncbi:MAG TPA: HutD family protein [Novosphingobium sp.]|nr:HutD family protein [Novosphingobium sp.]